MPDIVAAAEALTLMAKAIGLIRYSINEEVRGYRDTLERLVVDGVNGNMRRSPFVQAMQNEIIERAQTIYVEGLREQGREPPEPTKAEQGKINDWILSQTSNVGAFADAVFEAAKLKGDERTAARGELLDRVAVWVDSLNWLGQSAAVADDEFLTYDGDDGDESCPQCQQWKGKRRHKSEWDKDGLIARNGNPNFDCGRWENCHHSFFNDAGEMVIA